MGFVYAFSLAGVGYLTITFLVAGTVAIAVPDAGSGVSTVAVAIGIVEVIPMPSNLFICFFILLILQSLL